MTEASSTQIFIVNKVSFPENSHKLLNSEFPENSHKLLNSKKQYSCGEE